ncbi:MAG TPA: hypothetical protein VMF29_01580 [Candidatus Edwardsbacteria bacterium]|nr:hypothetical protein [Candidatus Edwardsbacteria bacterium]
MRKMIPAAILGLLLLAGCSEYNNGPARNISAKRHPNLAAAQKYSWEAYQKILQAQEANGFDLAGHAQKARDLLVQANDELKQAAEAANENSGR